MARVRQQPAASQALVVRIKEMEEELRVLRQRLSGTKKARPTRFADLYGLWKGKSNFTYEEIKEAEIRLRDELLDDLGG